MSSICTLTRCAASLGDAVGHRQRLQAPAVSDVEGEAEAARGVEPLAQGPNQSAMFCTSMPGSGSKPSGTPAAAADATTWAHPATSRSQATGSDTGRAHPGPERHRLRTEVGADRRPPAGGSPPAPPRSSSQQRGRVLAPRVQQVTGAGLDDHGEVRARSSRPRDLGDPPGQVGGVRVEVAVVEGQRHAPVAEVGDDRERVGEPVVGEPVGAVPEAQAGCAVGAAHVGDHQAGQAAAEWGAAAATASPATGAPARAMSAPCRAGRPGDPGADRRADPPGGGLQRPRSAWAPPYCAHTRRPASAARHRRAHAGPCAPARPARGRGDRGEAACRPAWRPAAGASAPVTSRRDSSVTGRCARPR